MLPVQPSLEQKPTQLQKQLPQIERTPLTALRRFAALPAAPRHQQQHSDVGRAALGIALRRQREYTALRLQAKALAHDMAIRIVGDQSLVADVDKVFL